MGMSHFDLVPTQVQQGRTRMYLGHRQGNQLFDLLGHESSITIMFRFYERHML